MLIERACMHANQLTGCCCAGLAGSDGTGSSLAHWALLCHVTAHNYKNDPKSNAPMHTAVAASIGASAALSAIYAFNADYVVIWARNTETKQINAFVVKKGTPGFRTSKIENKIALRCVQNADITMTRCVVPDSARLPGVDSFQVLSYTYRTYRVKMACSTSQFEGVDSFQVLSCT